MMLPIYTSSTPHKVTWFFLVGIVVVVWVVFITAVWLVEFGFWFIGIFGIISLTLIVTMTKFLSKIMRLFIQEFFNPADFGIFRRGIVFVTNILWDIEWKHIGELRFLKNERLLFEIEVQFTIKTLFKVNRLLLSSRWGYVSRIICVWMLWNLLPLRQHQQLISSFLNRFSKRTLIKIKISSFLLLCQFPLIRRRTSFMQN